MTPRPPVLGFVGIHTGRAGGQAISQNETVAALLARDGYRVRTTSPILHWLPRTLHQLVTILGWWRRVDVLVVATFSGRSFAMADLASLLGRVLRVPVVLFLEGGNLPDFADRHPAWVARVLGRADRLCAPSDYLAEAFRGRGHRVDVIPNTVDLDRYTFRRRGPLRPRLMWMRTYHPHYAPLLAVDVLARVRREHPDAVLFMAGADHGLRAEVEAHVERSGLGDCVSVHGYIDLEAKLAAMDAHDLYLNTNTVDNVPVSVVEAAASGMVVVATAVGGVPYLVTDGVDGVLVPPGDADAMAGAVCDLLDDPDRAGALSEGAERLAARHAWPAVRARWIEELAAVVPGRAW